MAPSPASRPERHGISQPGLVLLRSPHPDESLTDIAARERLSDRSVHLVAELVSDHLELFGGQRVRVHVRVHRGEEVDGDKARSRAQERRLQ